MTKHTPGPWKVVTGSVFTEDNKPIANMVRDDSALEAGILPVERDRNAYLCAAAPNLLEACKELQPYFLWLEENNLIRIKCLIEAAIAKATQ